MLHGPGNLWNNVNSFGIIVKKYGSENPKHSAQAAEINYTRL